LKPAALAKLIAQLSLTKKAGDVVIMNLKGLSSVADFFVICSADSDVQVRAIADAVQEATESKGFAPWHVEAGSSNWVILDYVDVVLHVFHKNARSFYSLERLWGDAAVQRLEDQPKRAAQRKSAAKKPARRTVTKRKVAS
jgi:ribosome-associated protein